MMRNLSLLQIRHTFFRQEIYHEKLDRRNVFQCNLEIGNWLSVDNKIFSDIKWMKENSKHAGTVLLISYEICIYSHLFISLNRMCAIFAPLKYNKIFRYIILNLYLVICTESLVMQIPPSSFSSAGLVLYCHYYTSMVTVRLLWGESFKMMQTLDDCNLYYIEEYSYFGFTNNPTCLLIAW